MSLTQPLQVFSYSRCSTCHKALSWLKENGIDHVVIDIVSSPPSRDQLALALNHFGERKVLFNTSGQSYRALGASVVKSMSDDEALDALAADGKLIKRPFVIRDGGMVLVGFKPEVWEQQFQS